MLAFTDNFQLILLLVAGIIWVIGQVWGAAKQFRASTRARMERQDQQRRLEIEPRPPSMTMTAPEPEPMLMPAPEPEPERAPPPVRPLRPIKRPPRVKKKRPALRRPAPAAAKPVRATFTSFDLRGRMRNRAQLREAVVLREILGLPTALRGRRRR